MAGLYEKKTDDELIDLMRNKASTSFEYIEMDAELRRRVAVSNLKAGKAQVRAAWYQFAAVIAMFLTVLATVAHR